MRLPGFLNRQRLAFILVLDVLALGVFYYFIPYIHRPFEVLMGGVTVLAALTVWAARRGALQTAMIVVASFSFAFFVLEMGQKQFNILNAFTVAWNDIPLGEGGDYAWIKNNPVSYFAARDKARRDGMEPDVVDDRFVGDFFAGVDPAKLWSFYKKDMGSGRHQHEIGLKGFYLSGPPFGYELAPDNSIRSYGLELDSGRTIYDARATIDRYGLRETRGNPDSDEAYLFLGCSFTYGSNISDDETLPHFFSGAMGFEKRVINLGVPGYGPNQALRELELEYHLGNMVVGTVKGVYFLLIDDHPRRVVTPAPDTAPYYALENGRAVFKGGFFEHQGRLGRMMERSRIYPILRERLGFRTGSDELPWQWRTAIAVLAEMDRICRDRYGVPCNVIYWGSNPRVMKGIREKGLPLLPVRDAFGEDWEKEAIKFYIFDAHPSRHGNRLLAQYLHAATVRGGAPGMTDETGTW